MFKRQPSQLGTYHYVDPEYDRPGVVFVSVWLSGEKWQASYYWDPAPWTWPHRAETADIDMDNVEAVFEAAEKVAASKTMHIFVRIDEGARGKWPFKKISLVKNEKETRRQKLLYDLQRTLHFLRRKFRDPSFAERPSRSGAFNLQDSALMNPGHRAKAKAEIRRTEARFPDELVEARAAPEPETKEKRAIARELHRAEVTALRSEILDIKNREMTTQAIALGILGAVHYAIWTDYFSTWLWLAQCGVALIPLAAVMIGYMRFQENRRNIFEIDNYLIEIEKEFDPRGGWATYFFMIRPMTDYFYSGKMIWRVLVLAALVGVAAPAIVDLWPAAPAADSGSSPPQQLPTSP